MDKLSEIFDKYPQKIINLKVKNKEEFFSNNELIKKINMLSESLDNDSRLVIRPSGTEPLIRIMADSKLKKNLNNILNKAESIIRNHMAVEN